MIVNVHGLWIRIRYTVHGSGSRSSLSKTFWIQILRFRVPH